LILCSYHQIVAFQFSLVLVFSFYRFSKESITVFKGRDERGEEWESKEGRKEEVPYQNFFSTLSSDAVTVAVNKFVIKVFCVKLIE